MQKHYEKLIDEIFERARKNEIIEDKEEIISEKPLSTATANHIEEDDGEKLIKKLKNGIKQTNNGKFVIHTSYDNGNICECKDKKKICFSPGNKKDYFSNKYEKYNTESIAYAAYKKYSQCKPKDKNFYSRMKFYAVKAQTRNEVVNMLIEKNKPKLNEAEKIKTFNRLIKDSNRRAEAKNRIEMLNTNKKIAKEIYDTDISMPIRSKRKFNKEKFDLEYDEKVTKKIKERQKSIDYYRQLQIEEEKRKEDEIVNEMKKFHKTASKKRIEIISQRLYNEAINRRIKNELFISESNKEIKMRNIKSKSNRDSFISELNEKRINKEKTKKKSINITESSHSIQTINNKEQYCPYYNAEKMVYAFFKK